MSTLRNKTKMGPQRSGMTHARWREVQGIAGRKSAARLFWPASKGTFVRSKHLNSIPARTQR